MLYIENPSTTAISASRGSQRPQFQQTPWTFKRSENNTSATLLSESQFQLLKKYYVFRNDTEIIHILRGYPFLAQLLLDTYSKIEAHFPDALVFLDVAVDYEDMDYDEALMNNSEELVASISTHLSPGEAIEALTSFYTDWWLKASSEAKGKISIGLEFL